MIKIGFEISYVIRDIDSQILKYYCKDIDKTFDDELFHPKEDYIFDVINFKSKSLMNKFLHIDYPFEIFGCARTYGLNLANTINMWLEDLEKREDDTYKACAFGLRESELVMQGSMYFLSKSPCRFREIKFPEDGKDIWDDCDVVVSVDERVAETKPEGKKLVLIKYGWNKDLEKYADLCYDSLDEMLNDKEFFEKIK